MSEIKQINTGVAELLAVKVPEGATKFFVHPFMSILCFTKEDGSSGFIEFNEPLTGPWELLGIDTELTEEQCRELMPKSDRYRGVNDRWVDYTQESTRYPYLFKTAKEAFASIMQANGCYSANPYDKPDIQYYMSDSAFTMRQYHEEFDKWQQAEANTGPRLILKRLS